MFLNWGPNNLTFPMEVIAIQYQITHWRQGKRVPLPNSIICHVLHHMDLSQKSHGQLHWTLEILDPKYRMPLLVLLAVNLQQLSMSIPKSTLYYPQVYTCTTSLISNPITMLMTKIHL